MFGTFSHAPELIILLVIALVIFGPKKIPDLGKGLGQGIKEFRRATTGEDEKADTPATPEPPAAASSPEPAAPAEKVEPKAATTTPSKGE